MERLNAIDAIAPALGRSRQLMFQPFRLGRSWKLAASSYVALCGSAFIPFPLIFLVLPHAVFGPGGMGTAIWVFSLVLSVLWLLLFYVFVRMEMVEFDIVVSGTKFVAPLWRRHAGRVWPWALVKIAIGTVVSAIAAPVLYFRAHQLFANLQGFAPTPGQDPRLLAAQMHAQIHAVLGVYAVLFVPFLVLKIISTLLADFVLPFYILEGLPLSDAMARGFEVLAADPWQCLGYLVCKYVLATVGFMMQYIANFVCMIPLMIVFGICAGIGYLIGHALGTGGKLLLIPGGILLYIGFIVSIFYTTIGSLGYLLLSLEAYAVYFLGGRYPLLGNLLEPGVARPFTPPPPQAGPDEGGGPPFPMDPAIA